MCGAGSAAEIDRLERQYAFGSPFPGWDYNPGSNRFSGVLGLERRNLIPTYF